MNEKMLSRALAPLMRRIRLMCSRGRVNLVNDGHGAQNLQVSLLSGEPVDNIERLQNYGFSSVPNSGAEVVVLAVGGKREHLVALAVEDRSTRPSAKSPGDVVVYHAEGHCIRLAADGRCIMTCKQLEMYVDEDAELNARKFIVNAETELNGPVNAPQGMKINGIEFIAHAHPEHGEGGGITGGPQ